MPTLKNQTPKRKRVSSYLYTLGLMVAVAVVLLTVAVFRVTETLDQRSQAKYAADRVMTSRVLVIGYDPTEGGRSLANTYYRNGMGGKTAAEFELSHPQEVAAGFSSLSNGLINYQIVDTIRITDFPRYADGFSYTVDSFAKCVWGTPQFENDPCEARKWLFPYVTWLKDNKICEKAKAVNADEIWLYSVPFITAWETFGIGPKPGFPVNGGNYIIPECEKNYIVVNPSYERPENFFHNYGHRVEALMSYMTSFWKTEDRDKYWRNPAGMQFYDNAPRTSHYCGNAHYPSNSTKAYDYVNPTTAAHNCQAFSDFPLQQGKLRDVSCKDWGCSDMGWQKFWLSYIPRKRGTVALTARNGQSFKFEKNWWTYILDPQKVISYRDSMVYTSSPSPMTSPKISPLPTPMTSPKVSAYPSPVSSFYPKPSPF